MAVCAYYVTHAGCRYDGTVRTAIGSIVQFLYGEDGMDGTRIEGQGLDHLNMDVSSPTASWAVYRLLKKVHHRGSYNACSCMHNNVCCILTDLFSMAVRQLTLALCHCDVVLLLQEKKLVGRFAYQVDDVSAPDPDWLAPDILDLLRTDQVGLH